MEDVGLGPQLHVGVDERAAADTGGGYHRDVAHHPQVEEPLRVELLVPEHRRGFARVGSEVFAAEAPPPLEHADPLARLRQPAGGDAAAEAGADDDGVIFPGHRDPPPYGA